MGWAGQDSRAATLLETTRQHLQAEAEKIEDDMLRQSFLENIPAHHEIMRE